MQRYYDELATYQRDGFEIIVDKTYEDLDPKDLFMSQLTLILVNHTSIWTKSIAISTTATWIGSCCGYVY